MSAARYIALLVCSVLTCIAIVGCVPTSAYVSARQIQTAASGFVDTAADTWHAYSHARLENIKDSCGDLDCFKTVSAQWESGTVAPADKAITAAKNAVLAFDATLNATNAAQQKDFSAAVQQVVAAVASLVSILNGYGLSLALFKVL